MKFTELTREQKVKVKQRLLCETREGSGIAPTWGELADVDNVITDAECEEKFKGTEFVPEDFSPEPATEPATEQRRYTAQVLAGLAEWVEQTFTDAEYAKGNDRYMPIHYDESCGIAWAREKILARLREMCQ